MDFIVEIQGFTYGESCAFLPKEVAVVALSKDYSEHWFITSPCSFASLSGLSKKGNTYLTRHFHGIEFVEKGISLEQLKTNLQRIARHASNFLTRGSEKTAFLQDVIGRNIINLEKIPDVPSFRRLPPCDTYCLLHGVEKAEAYRCALNGAVALKKYLLNANSNTTPPDSCYDEVYSQPRTSPCDREPIFGGVDEVDKEATYV